MALGTGIKSYYARDPAHTAGRKGRPSGVDGVKCSFQEQCNFEPRGCINRGYSDPFGSGYRSRGAFGILAI